MVSLQYLVETLGYPVVFLGTFFEGETILVIAGFVAHRGYLDLPWVILLAFTGSFCGDQFFFFLGRTKGRDFLSARPAWQVSARKAQRLLDRYQTYVLLGFRFLYGLRMVIPFLVGASGFRPSRFLLLNVIGALVWSVIVALAGYLFGAAAEALLEDVKRYEVRLLVLLAVVGGVLWVVHSFRQRRSRPASDAGRPGAGGKP